MYFASEQLCDVPLPFLLRCVGEAECGEVLCFWVPSPSGGGSTVWSQVVSRSACAFKYGGISPSSPAASCSPRPRHTFSPSCGRSFLPTARKHWERSKFHPCTHSLSPMYVHHTDTTRPFAVSPFRRQSISTWTRAQAPQSNLFRAQWHLARQAIALQATAWCGRHPEGPPVLPPNL